MGRRGGIRELVRQREQRRSHAVYCANCATRCETFNGRTLVPWAADHIVPLADGGADALPNLQVLCLPCHRRKTGREATTRAIRRMKRPMAAAYRRDAP